MDEPPESVGFTATTRGAPDDEPFLLQRIKGTGAPSLHTGMFVEGAEQLSPFNEHSLLGIETSDSLGSLQ
jgi:hypothetical protein